jgi:hypothetical protein
MDSLIQPNRAAKQATPITGQRMQARRAYHTPRLEVLGDIRDLTLGGSPGQGDSGQTNFGPLGLSSENWEFS